MVAPSYERALEQFHEIVVVVPGGVPVDGVPEDETPTSNTNSKMLWTNSTVLASYEVPAGILAKLPQLRESINSPTDAVSITNRESLARW